MLPCSASCTHCLLICVVDDLPVLDPSTPKPPSGQWLVVDTNVALHQMDILEHSAISHCIILQTGAPTPRNSLCVCSVGVLKLCAASAVLNETRHRNVQLYTRLRRCINDAARGFVVFSNEHHRETYVERQPGESANDRNDRAIRRAAEWYADRMAASGAKVVMVTNDRDNSRLALANGLQALSMQKLVDSFPEHPELQDLLAHMNESDDQPTRTTTGSRAPTNLYPQHLPLSQVMAGVKNGTLKQGVFHSNRYNMNEAHIALQSGKGASEDIGAEQDDLDPLLPLQSNSVLVSGWVAQNRATNGDVVAIEMLPEEEWTAPSERLVEGDTDHDSSHETAASKAKRRPCAKVVGIIRRAWRPFCGTLDVKNVKGKLSDGVSTQLLFVPA